MADINTSITPNARPEVNLRTPSLAPSVIAREIPTSTPGIGVAPQTSTDQLLKSLNIGGEALATAGKEVTKEERQDQLLKGQQEAQKNQLEWADAVSQGKVDQTANPWFIKGYQEQDGRVAGLNYYTDMRQAYAQSPAKGSDDPKVYQQFVSDFTKQWMETKGAGKTTEWQSGFATTSNSALAQVNAEHAQNAEAAVVNTQKTNTGAEVNAILNTSANPEEAGKKINEFGAKMRAMGMPQKDFEEAVGNAILAKAKGGDGTFLDTFKYVQTGGPPSAPADNMAMADKAMKLSPQEKALYQRHLTNLGGKGGVDNADGSRSSLFATTVEIEGKTYILPTVYDGKKLPPKEAIERAQAEGLQNFPSYATEDAAQARYKQLHDYMEKDTQVYQTRGNSPIATIESGGKYDAIGNEVTYPNGTKDRAYGKYQVMGNNIPAWTKEVLGKSMTPAQFLADENAQEQVYKVKHDQLVAKYGEEGAARAWFAGEGGMNNLSATDVNGMSVGRYGRTAASLASNPKFAAAMVDTQEYLKEKARGDVRWAEGREDRQWTLQSRDWAKQSHAQEADRYAREQATWGRQDKTRSLQSQIMLSTMEAPEDAYASNRERLADLAKIDPTAAKEAGAWIDSFTERREKVDAAVEKPVVAQITSDMVTAAGSPERQAQLMMDISRQYRNGKINKDTLMHLMDDAQRMAAFDPSTVRKLNSPEVTEVKSAISQIFTQDGKTNPFGSAAQDALDARQAVNRAVVDALKANPNIPDADLGELANKALQRHLDALGKGKDGSGLQGRGDGSDLAKKAGIAAQRTNQSPAYGPPVPQQTADQAAAALAPADLAAVTQHFHEEFQKSPVAGMKALADFDAGVGIPGLGRTILERNSKPPELPKKKGR